jgi:ketosteroid isomerase-like protein
VRTMVRNVLLRAAHATTESAPLRNLPPILIFVLSLGLATVPAAHSSGRSMDDDRRTVAALDTEYQAAVKRNDAAAMARILADDFALVTGSGHTYTKADMLADARRGDMYAHNDEEVQTVRIWGDTAVVTGKLWEEFTSEGKSFDQKFWFSDTYFGLRRDGSAYLANRRCHYPAMPIDLGSSTGQFNGNRNKRWIHWPHISASGSLGCKQSGTFRAPHV